MQAGVSCKTCHGPIDEMEVVYQYAPLTMGWCMDCHRNDNYVGGPDYQGTPESFTVGTANYDVLRARIIPDRVVKMSDVHVKSAYDPTFVSDAETMRNIFDESIKDDLHNTEYLTQRQMDVLNEAFARYPEMPRWKVPELPELHAEFYGEFKADADGDGTVTDIERERSMPTCARSIPSLPIKTHLHSVTPVTSKRLRNDAKTLEIDG